MILPFFLRYARYVQRRSGWTWWATLLCNMRVILKYPFFSLSITILHKEHFMVLNVSSHEKNVKCQKYFFVIKLFHRQYPF